MKVLVVGGAGYLGSVLVRRLLKAGYKVRVYDRMFFGDVGLKSIKKKVELVVGDMREVDDKVFKGIDAVINLAGLSNDPTAEYNPRANWQMNTLATESLALKCKANGIKRYIFSSTCSIYDVGPVDEEKDVVVNEETKVNPQAAYSSSKYAAEKRLLKLVDDRFCPVILRQGTIFGFSPRMRYDLVLNTFVKDAMLKGAITIHLGGEMWRPLVSVEDAARVYLMCLEAPEKKVRGQVFNVVGRNIRISELALRTKDALQALGVPVEVKHDYKVTATVRSYRATGKKTERVLGFKPRVSVHDAVKNLHKNILKYKRFDFENPKYYNIRWMMLLEEAESIIERTGYLMEKKKKR